MRYESEGTLFYAYGLQLGIKLLLHGKIKHALPFLIVPVNYWRHLEYKLVWREADFCGADLILDVGSPKLLSIFLAKRLGARVVATDIEDYFVRKYGLLRRMERLTPERFQIAVEDGRHTSFADNTFNKIYAISVVEHIPGDGDKECLAELSRILAPGGRLLVTVPFAPVSKVEYLGDNFYWSGSSTQTDDGRVFYQRRYSEDDVRERLIRPSGLTLEKIVYFGDNILVKSEKELSDYLHPGLGPLHPLLSMLFHSKPSDSWQALKKPLGALIVLEKH